VDEVPGQSRSGPGVPGLPRPQGFLVPAVARIDVEFEPGTATITDLVFPAEGNTALAVVAEGEGAHLVALAVVGR
jgi:hypothetical protein